GRIGVRAALAWCACQALVGFAVLLTFNRFAVLVGVASLGVVAIYPFAKRFTSWPQLVLGFAFAWGALLSWAAALGALHWPALWLYLAAILWTIGYDTIYALQDLRDDAIMGIRSTARLFGDDVRLAVGAIYLLTVACAEVALWLVRVGPLAQLGLVAFAAHLVWQVRRLDDATPAVALRLFRSNRDAGLLFFLGLAADALAVARGFY
ncbi:MAG: UbiA family prenyltransferase, partial [Hyphomicrobiales bacterium]|nr:UbiA family prenyltransferase [Hyphomicrobiales bacterium]